MTSGAAGLRARGGFAFGESIWTEMKAAERA